MHIAKENFNSSNFSGKKAQGHSSNKQRSRSDGVEAEAENRCYRYEQGPEEEDFLRDLDMSLPLASHTGVRGTGGGVGGVGGVGGTAHDLDSTKLSVDFEGALEQMLASIHSGDLLGDQLRQKEKQQQQQQQQQQQKERTSASSSSSRRRDLDPVPVLQQQSPSPTRALASASSSSSRISSLRQVDQRLEELKQEKLRLRRLLMDRVQDL
jgi:hypothetical protein